MTKIDADRIPVATKIEGTESQVDGCGESDCEYRSYPNYDPAPQIETMFTKLIDPDKLVPGSHWDSGRAARVKSIEEISYNIYIEVYFASAQPAGRIVVGKIKGASEAERYVEAFDTSCIVDARLSAAVHALMRYAGAGALVVVGKELVGLKK